MGWVCSTNRSERERKFVFVGRKLGRLRYRKENDIKIDIQRIEWGGWGVDRIVLAQERDK